MQTLNNRIESLDAKIDALTIQVSIIDGKITSRAEIAAEDNKRVSLEMYTTAHQALVERLGRLESGPQRMLGWISLFVSGGVGCFALVLTGIGAAIAALALLVTIAIAVIPHLH